MSKGNLHLAIACLLILAISFSAIFAYLTVFDVYASQTFGVDGNFDGVDFTKKKILVLGASSVDVLNFTRIDEDLAENGWVDYEVFNLTEDGDRPTKRIAQIDELLKIKPDLVLYGLGMREFGYDTFSPGLTKCLPLNYDAFWDIRKEIPTKPILADTIIVIDFEPLALMKNLIQDNVESLLPEFVEPKFATISFLNNVIYQKEIKSESFLNKNYTELKKQGGVKEIISNERLEKKLNGMVLGYCNDVNSEELNSLKEILDAFKENSMDVRVFVAPYSGAYLDVMSDLVIRHYFVGLYKTTSSSNVELYSFLDRYADMEIFHDATHVAANQESLAYSKDFALFVSSIIESKEKNKVTENLLKFRYGKLSTGKTNHEQFDRLDSLNNLDLSGAELTNENLSGKKIISTDFTHANLEHVDLSHSVIADSVLNGANMYFSNLSNVKIINTSMQGVNLFFADITNATLSDVDFRYSLVMGVDFSRINLADIDFSGANLLKANFTDSSLTNVDFSSAELSQTDFNGAQRDNKTRFTGTKLIESDLSNFDMSFLDLSGVTIIDANLTNTSFRGSEFVFSDLSGSDLSTSDMTGVTLLASDLSFTSIPNAQFSQINAKHVTLDNANLTGADLSFADFVGARFVNADLTGANLTGTKLQFANFTGAILDGVDLRCLDSLICDEETR
jgi:uncharacterized protein YjbI with pentapeptide repeats